MKKLILSLCLSTTACSSLDLRYDADIQIEHLPAKYSFEKSYSMEGQAVACLTTFYLIGGACWVYLMRPLNGDKEKLMSDVKADLDSRLSAVKYDIKSDEIKREGWDFSSQKSTLTYAK